MVALMEDQESSILQQTLQQTPKSLGHHFPAQDVSERYLMQVQIQDSVKEE